MSNMNPIDVDDATGTTKELLDRVRQRTGRIPNMIQLMANSPAALGAYLSFAGAFRDAILPPHIRDLIAVTVAETAGCDYTLSAVSALARSGGRTEGELAAARAAESEDPRIAVALRFAAKIVTHRGHLPAADVSAVRDAGFSDGEIADIVAVVALNVYRAWFNLIARPEVDFPLVTAGGPP